MPDVEVTVVVRWRDGYQPDETEWRELVEDVWLGDLLTVEEEPV